MRTITPVQQSPVPPVSAEANDPTPVPQEPADNRPQVLVPGTGRPISEFASELGEILGSTRQWYARNDRVVRLREVEVEAPTPGGCRGARSFVFHYPSPNECRSLLERYARFGSVNETGGLRHFVVGSIGRETTGALLESPQFKERLPVVRRILDVPIPVEIDGRLVMAQPGYDARLQTYCRGDIERIEPLPLQEAKTLLAELFEGFPFANELSRTLAYARLLTPFVRGLMGWTARTPLWVFEANRPRAGKDYLAGCCGLLYEGRANEDSPLDRDSNETRKRIMAALQSGRRFMHFANTSGDIRNDAFEQAVTAKSISGRLLGSNDAASDLTLPNELEFSVSGNTGFTFSEDFALRCRRISLAYYEEDANSRRFPKPDLHGWVIENRTRILGALLGLVMHWDSQGRPAAPNPFTSFPEWARIVGGIMVACELGDPCVPQTDGTFTRDSVTEDMTNLFQLAANVHHGEWLAKGQVRDLIAQRTEHNRHHDMELFPQWDLQDRSGQTAFGAALARYQGRVLGGIRMEVDSTDKKRIRYRFVPADNQSGERPEGNPVPRPIPVLGTLGTLST